MRTLYNMLFKRQLKGNLVWSVSVALMTLVVVVLYPYVKDMYTAMPPEVMAIMEQFGGIPSNALEYYATEGAMMTQLFGSIYAAMLGFTMINLFESEKTAEVLYVQGTPKRTFYISKQLLMVTLIILFSIVQYLFGLLGFAIIKENVNHLDYIYFHLIDTLLLVVFAYLGFGMCLLLKSTSKVMTSIILPLPLYVLTLVSSLTDNDIIKGLKYASPFTFADPVVILKNQTSIDSISLIVYISVIIIISTMFFKLYKTRIHTV